MFRKNKQKQVSFGLPASASGDHETMRVECGIVWTTNF